MTAVLMALQMVGISPTQQNSRPVIWVPVDVPEPPTTHVESKAVEITEHRDLHQRCTSPDGRGKEAGFAGSDKTEGKGKRSYCQVHGTPTRGIRLGQSTKSTRGPLSGAELATGGREKKPVQVTSQHNGLAKNTTRSTPGTGVTGNAVEARGTTTVAVPGCGANVSVGVVAMSGTVGPFTTAVAGGLSALRVAPGKSPELQELKDEEKAKLQCAHKDRGSGKSVYHNESTVTAGRGKVNSMAVCMALAVLLASLTAAFSLLLVLGTQQDGYEALVRPNKERSGPTERKITAVTEEGTSFETAQTTDERESEPVSLGITEDGTPRPATLKISAINETSLDDAVL